MKNYYYQMEGERKGTRSHFVGFPFRFYDIFKARRIIIKLIFKKEGRK